MTFRRSSFSLASCAVSSLFAPMSLAFCTAELASSSWTPAPQPAPRNIDFVSEFQLIAVEVPPLAALPWQIPPGFSVHPRQVPARLSLHLRVVVSNRYSRSEAPEPVAPLPSSLSTERAPLPVPASALRFAYLPRRILCWSDPFAFPS